MKCFIVAYPRSGTTYLAKCLVQDLGFYSSPESHFLHELGKKVLCNGSLSNKDLKAFLNKNFKFQSWEIPLRWEHDLTVSNFEQFYELILADLNGVSIASIREGVCVDHTPENALNIEELNKLFCSVTFIHLKRDPRALFSSIRDLNWGSNTIGNFCKSFNLYEKEIEKSKKQLSDKFKSVKFEEFINEDSNFRSDISGYIGSYKPSIGKKFFIPKYSEDQHKLVKSKPDKTRAKGWERTLSNYDILKIESHISSVFFSYVYRSERSHKYSRLSAIYEFFLELFYKVKNKLNRMILEKRP